MTTALGSFGKDSQHTAPSKRIEKLVPEYQKLLMGVQAAQDIGLETICAECLHFRRWMERLVGLAEDVF